VPATATLRSKARRLGVAACALLPLAVAAGGSYSVIPVRVQFGPRDRAVAVTLTNLGDAPLALVADLYRWEQNSDGSDRLTPTDDLVLAPGLVRIPAKGQQVVRLALLRPADPQIQMTYRMFVREQPDLSQPVVGVAIPVSVAMSLPVFITPPTARWDVECTTAPRAAATEVRCANNGTATALVRSVQLESGGKVVSKFEGAAYLLPGASRPITLQPAVQAGSLPGKLTVVFEDNQTAAYELR
jgi:fimbrial chaperone protein